MCLTSHETAKQLSKEVITSFYIFHNCVWRDQLLHILTNIWCLWVFSFLTILLAVKWFSLFYCFILIFLMTNNVEYFFVYSLDFDVWFFLKSLNLLPIKKLNLSFYCWFVSVLYIVSMKFYNVIDSLWYCNLEDIWSSSTVSGSQVPKPFEFPKCWERWSKCFLYVNAVTFGSHPRVQAGC